MPKAKIVGYSGDAWTRQPKESDSQWRAFQYFQKLEGVRALPEVAEYMGLALPTIRTYCAQMKWKERVNLYDIHVSREATKTAIQRSADMRSQHISLAKTGLKFVKRELEKYLRLSNQEEWPVSKLRELSNIADSLSKLERLSMGESTENVAVNKRVSVEVLQSDELKTLKGLLTKANTGKVKQLPKFTDTTIVQEE